MIYSTEDINKCYALNYNHDSHNEYTDDNITKGIMGEKFIMYFLTNEKHMGFKGVKGNDLDRNRYPREHGFDIEIPDIGLVAEVKDNNGKYYLGNKDIEEQGLIPICKSNAKIKLLFVAHNTFTSSARETLKSCRVHIIEWGEQIIEGTNWGPSLYSLRKKFYPIYYKYKRLFDQVSRLVQSSTTKLTHILHNNKIIDNNLDNLVLNGDIRGEKGPPAPALGWRKALGTRINEVIKG